MRTVTAEEILDSMNVFHEMTESEARRFMERMSKEQPYIQLYIAAILDRGDFEDENDADAFADLAAIIWHVMRKAAGGRLVKIKGGEIDRREAKIIDLYEYAEDEAEEDWPDLVNSWIKGCNQRPLLEFVLNSLFSPENPYGLTSERGGMIMTYLRVIIDCLDNARLR